MIEARLSFHFIPLDCSYEFSLQWTPESAAAAEREELLSAEANTFFMLKTGPDREEIIKIWS